MSYIYLLLAVISISMLSIMATLFNNLNKSAKNISSLYNLIVTLSTCSSWGIIYLFNFEFNANILIYSLLYGIFYTTAMIGLFGALKNGSVSLTSFIKQLSLVAVAVWGFFFWQTPVTVNIAIGMLLIILAIYFCFKPDKNETHKISLKWLIYSLMLLIGNSGCSIIQKYQQMSYPGHYGSMLMFFACGLSVVVCFVIHMQNKKINLKNIRKKTLFFPIIAGLSSTLFNLFIILLAQTSLSPAIIYPATAVGGMILTILFSLIFCQEKLTIWLKIGLFTGAIALIFLNLK